MINNKVTCFWKTVHRIIKIKILCKKCLSLSKIKCGTFDFRLHKNSGQTTPAFRIL